MDKKTKDEFVDLFAEGFQGIVVPEINKLDKKIDKIDQRLTKVEHRLETVENRLESVERKLDRVVDEHIVQKQRLKN